MKTIYITLFIIVLLVVSCGSSKDVTVTAVNDFESYMPGKRVYTAFQFKMTGGWHIYWQNPGDAGLATAIEWVLPEGFGDVAVEYSIPNKYVNDDIGDYGYKPEATIITNFKIPTGVPRDTTFYLTAYVKYLKCRDICVPGVDTILVEIPVINKEPVLTSGGLKLKERYNSEFPFESSNWIIQFNKTETEATFTITSKKGNHADFSGIEFYPITEGIFSNSAAQKLVKENGSYILTVPFDPLGTGITDGLSGLFVADKPWEAGKSRALKYRLFLD